MTTPTNAPGTSAIRGVLEAPPGDGMEPAEQRAAPIWLWVAALLVLAPVGIPLLAMLARIVGASGNAWETVFSGRTFELVLRSALLTTLVTAAATTIGVAAAWITVRTNVGLGRLWGVLMVLPLVIPSYVFALAFLAASGPRGLIADATGIAVPFLDGLSGAWLALTLSTFPYVYLVTVAALQRLDPALEEAGRSLGASPSRVFRTVTLPALRPALGAGALLAALYTVSDFGAVSLMRFDAFTRVIYAQYAGRLDRTPAAVLSIVLIAIALIVLWAEQRTRGRSAAYARRPARRARRHQLTARQRVGAAAFLGSVAALGVAIPVAVLAAWVARGVAAGATVTVSWNAVAGSLLGSSLAAILAVVAAIPVVVLAVRHRNRATDALERSVYVTFSLPHITVALAVLIFAVRYLGPFYQSLALLVVVYASMFLAQATGAAKASLLQVNPHLEEAARGLGRGPFRTMWDVTIPLVWRGLLAGGALVFLTTMKELPATLLLRPTGFETLAVSIWAAADELFYARAAAAALVLLAVSAVPAYLLVVRPQEASP